MVSPHQTRGPRAGDHNREDAGVKQGRNAALQAGELVKLVREAFSESQGHGEHCAITSRARSLNGPYDFKEVSSLAPGRSGHNEPLPIAALDRDTGLREIKQNFLNLKDEHAWIYVPQLGVWIDDTTDVEEHGVSSDPFLRTILLRTYSELEVFHTHPDQLYRSLHQDGLLPNTYLTIAATPSRGDQFSAAALEDFAGPRANLKSHVVSHHGVTSYYRTAEFRRDDSLIAKPFDWDFTEIDVRRLAQDEIRRICEKLERTVASRKSDGSQIPTWKIRFEPFE
jgi:hypothetical protein